MDVRGITLLIALINQKFFQPIQSCTTPDFFTQMNHIDCSHKELVNIYTINVYKFPKSLDLSYNEFTKIADNMFRDTQLLAIEWLNFSFNKIWSVGPFAFTGLNALKRLDLSNNEITKLDLKFWPNLLMLNVSSNLLTSQFRIQCESLEILDISKNQLEFMFDVKAISNLKHLNLSNNKIDAMPSEQFLNLNLVSLQVRGNKLRCDTMTSNMFQFLRTRGVDVNPTCPPIQGRDSISISPAGKPSPTFHQIPTSNPVNSAILPMKTTIGNFDDTRQLENIQQMQEDLWILTIVTFSTQFSIIGLLIFLCILVIIFRMRDSRNKNAPAIPEPLEAPDEDEPPPPPYRNHASGFII